MPTYEYICEKCGKGFEVFQSMKDPHLTVCPKDKCPNEKWGKGKVKRAIGGGAGLIFKGSGFYITDYRSDSYKSAAKKDSESKSSSSKPKEKSGGSDSGKSSSGSKKSTGSSSSS